jgi:glycosyltransferase involved in cell wall biosynthesis
LENRVFIGRSIQNIAAQYNSADLFVLPGLYESFSFELLEASSYHVPQIAYDVGYGSKEIIIDGKTGFLAKKGDVDDLADKIYTILRDDELRLQMSSNCIMTEERYFESVIFQKWENIFGKLGFCS